MKIINNQEDEKYDLVCSAKELKKNEDVYLIDHAWTFKYRDAEKNLRDNDKLLERMLNIIRYSEKQDLPINPYAKPRPSLLDYLKSLEESPKVYDLDEYGIKSLAFIPFKESAEQISLFNNDIENPGEITTILN